MNFSAILGPAGSGKSTELRNRAADNPNYARVCATTGIAAVNLGVGVTTINSTLKFFNEESAMESFISGAMARQFIALAVQGFENVVIDEVSMMSAKLLDIICTAAENAETHILQYRPELKPVGLILTGDFLQLPPVRGQFAFFSEYWPRFEENLTQLKTIYRQTDPLFLDALNQARAGKGVSSAIMLKQAGVTFAAGRNDHFDGMTIMPTNASVDTLNDMRFKLILAPHEEYKSVRWGDESGEWKDIPELLQMKEGALVTVLANQPREFAYVNGDIGAVLEMHPDYVTVEIRRGEQRNVQHIPFVFRETMTKNKPDGVAEFSGFLCDGMMFFGPKDIDEYFSTSAENSAAEKKMSRSRSASEWLDGDEEYFADVFATVAGEIRVKAKRKAMAIWFEQYDRYTRSAIAARKSYFSIDKFKWVTGWIEYMPLRLAYAATGHKVQGLTLDFVQIDARMCWRDKRSGKMAGAGSPGWMYTVLTRCRAAQNIRIVCGAGEFGKRVNTAEECLRWV